MGYSEYPPPARLQDWVKCFWSILDEPSDEIQEVWPDGCVEVVFSLGNTFTIDADGQSHPFPKGVVVGLQTQIMRVRHDGVLRLVGARLLPFGVGDWQAEELQALAAKMEPLLERDEFTAAVELLADWLEQQPRIDDQITVALRTLYAAGGNVRVAELAANQGISPRQLQRVFAGSLGITPKELARVVRFAESWSRMLSKPKLSLAELALELGYADQAHFSNEFRAFGGQSPRTFRGK